MFMITKRMEAVIFALAAAIAVNGCSFAKTKIKSDPYAQINNLQELNDDAAKQIASMYKPTKTRLVIDTKSDNIFASSMVESLRQKGFEVLDSTTDAQRIKKDNANANAQTVVVEKTSNIKEVAVDYVLDQVKNENIYYLTIHLNDEQVSKMYAYSTSTAAADKKITLIPLGGWIRRMR